MVSTSSAYSFGGDSFGTGQVGLVTSDFFLALLQLTLDFFNGIVNRQMHVLGFFFRIHIQTIGHQIGVVHQQLRPLQQWTGVLVLLK